MARGRFTLFGFPALLLMLPLCAASLVASETKTQQKTAQPATPPIVDTDAPKISSQTRLAIMRSLQSERVFSRVLFPQGKDGLKIKNGVISPSEMSVAQMVAENGPAAKPGDRCVITNVDVREKEIVFEINGGPKKSGKWYQHIQIVGASGQGQSLPGTPQQSLDAHGSVVKLQFEKYVPEMSGDQVRAMLAPVFDFKALTNAEAYQKTLPPQVQEAIKNHQVLVGMDKEMVVYAKGRAPQKVRDKDDKGQDYEEWIYGTPPEEVDFVRFKGNEVARLEIMTVDGQKIIRTEREVNLESKQSELAEKKPPKAANGPTLLRPGEQMENAPPPPSDQRDPRPQDRQKPADGSPYPDTTGMPVPAPGGSAPPQ